MLDTRWDGHFVGARSTYAPGTPLTSIRPILPDNGRPATGTIIVVNGIMTDVEKQRSELQALANTGARVIGIHNATEGLVRDMGQVTTDKLGRGPNPAVDAVVGLLRTELKAGRPVHLAGHSQGALIVARALDILKPELTRKQLQLITVDTYGGAARRFVDGPKYTHYMNRFDPAPWLLGLAGPLSREGAGARDVWVDEVRVPRNLPPLTEGVTNFFARVVDRMVHGAPEYFARREP
jgi:hypothetical protein